VPWEEPLSIVEGEGRIGWQGMGSVLGVPELFCQILNPTFAFVTPYSGVSSQSRLIKFGADVVDFLSS